MASLKWLSINLKMIILAIFFFKSLVLEAKQAVAKDQGKHVVPGLGSSLFAILQRYQYISILNCMG